MNWKKQNEETMASEVQENEERINCKYHYRLIVLRTRDGQEIWGDFCGTRYLKERECERCQHRATQNQRKNALDNAERREE